MQNSLFRNATLRLTAMYLIILMCISFLFSFGLYQVSSDELQKGIRRPNSNIEFILRTLSGADVEQIRNTLGELRADQLRSAEIRLRNNLVLINLFILLTGGVLSYVLARRTLEPIERAHTAQSRFTADASHELRTPIAAMRLETEITLSDDKLSLKEAKKQLASNIEELDKLTHLTENLLHLARMGAEEFEMEVFSLNESIDAAIDRVSPKAAEKQILIKQSSKKDLLINANKVSLTEAFATILDNAVKFSPQKKTVTIKVSQKQKHTYIAISDTGPGILPTDMPFIFDRFYRSDGSRTESQKHGYGIGLSIAKSAVEAHGGNIDVTSKHGEGATFTISLPTSH